MRKVYNRPEQTTARGPILARRRFSVARLGLSFFSFFFKRESNQWPIFLATQIVNTTILNKRIKLKASDVFQFKHVISMCDFLSIIDLWLWHFSQISWSFQSPTLSDNWCIPFNYQHSYLSIDESLFLCFSSSCTLVHIHCDNFKISYIFAIT